MEQLSHINEGEGKGRDGGECSKTSTALSGYTPRASRCGVPPSIAFAPSHRPRQIQFEFYNGFDGSPLGGGTMDYDPNRCMAGKYTKVWRVFKPGLADLYRLDKRHVRLRLTLIH